MTEAVVEPGAAICSSDALVEGGDGVRFLLQWHSEVASAFAVRSRGQVYGYLNRCAHVPVNLDWQPGRFFDASGLYLVCATHGALYAPESGACLGGRCNGRGLTAVPLIECNGAVYLKESED